MTIKYGWQLPRIGQREDRGNHDDYWGTKADHEHELDDDAKRDAHDRHECQADCDYCEEERSADERSTDKNR